MSQDILAEPGSSRFGRFIVAALVLEILALAALIYAPEPPPARVVKPATLAVHMVQPAPPKPKPAPLPPPPPVPALPKPPPPLPHHPHVAPKPLPKRVIHHPVIHRPPPPTPVPPTAPTLPAPPTPVQSAPAPSPAVVQSVEARYVATIRGIILGNLVVPAAMRNLGASGVATVAFKVAPDGQILSAKVLRASDYAAANRAALAAVRDSRFPAFFAKMPKHPIIFEVNINVSGAQ
ncbi:periplasmic protein TonB [Acidiphilium sp. MT5]